MNYVAQHMAKQLGTMKYHKTVIVDIEIGDSILAQRNAVLD